MILERIVRALLPVAMWAGVTSASYGELIFHDVPERFRVMITSVAMLYKTDKRFATHGPIDFVGNDKKYHIWFVNESTAPVFCKIYDAEFIAPSTIFINEELVGDEQKLLGKSAHELSHAYDFGHRLCEMTDKISTCENVTPSTYEECDERFVLRLDALPEKELKAYNEEIAECRARAEEKERLFSRKILGFK